MYSFARKCVTSLSAACKSTSATRTTCSFSKLASTALRSSSTGAASSSQANMRTFATKTSTATATGTTHKNTTRSCNAPSNASPNTQFGLTFRNTTTENSLYNIELSEVICKNNRRLKLLPFFWFELDDDV